MRSYALRRLLLLGTVLAPFACVTSSTSPPGTQPFDGGDGFDARADFDSSLPDATLPDCALPPPVDAGDAASAPGATVTVIGTNGLPKSGVVVIFQDANGTVVETKATDALGRATRSVADGSMVTVAAGGVGRRELFTFLGVKNGDQIAAVDVAPTAEAPSFSVAPTPTSGVFSYGAQAGDCFNAGSLPLALFVDLTRCQSSGKAPVVALGYNDSSQPATFTFVKDVPLAVDGGAVSITNFPAWSTNFGTFTVSATNAPAAVGANMTLLNAEIVGGVALHRSLDVAITEGASSAGFATMPGYATAFQPQVTMSGDGSNGAAAFATFMTKSVVPDGASQAFDLTGLWPQITTFRADTTDVARFTLSWAAAGAFPGADGGVAHVSFPAADAAADEPHGWTFVFPPGTTGLKAPQLPPAVAAEWGPTVAVGFDGVGFVDEDDIASYEVFLGRYPALATLSAGSTAVQAPVIPAGASLRASLGVPAP